MNRCTQVLVIIGLLLCAACSTMNNGLNPEPQRGASAFSITTEEGLGSFTPAMDVTENGSLITVTVRATQAEDLAAAYFYLHYDSQTYTPERVVVSDFLGPKDQVLSLALTNLPGEVPVGMMQIPSAALEPTSGSGTLATVTFRSEPFTGAKSVSATPASTWCEVKDLQITTQNGTQVNLQWTERNRGDCNNDGQVTINDLTPIGQLLNVKVPLAADPIWAALVDANGDTEINISDLSTLGSNFNSKVTGYIVYSDTAGVTPIEGATINRPATVDPKKPVIYNLQVDTPAGGAQFTVRPFDVPTSPGAVSNAAVVNVVPGPPEPPMNLTGNANLIVGTGKVQLNWTASSSGDVSFYEVERKLSADPETSYVKITDVPAAQTTYTDSGLTADEFNYRVASRDNEGNTSRDKTSGDKFSNELTIQPYFPPPPGPPQNPSAVPSGSASLAIDVSWDPASGTIQGYEVWGHQQGVGDFVLKTTTPGTSYTENGLTLNTTYEYYIIAVGAGGVKSDPTATVSSIPSTDVQIEITDVTTDKTTHLNTGAETAAQLNVVTNVAADTYTWSGAGVFSATNVANPTWHPDGATKLGKVTLTVSVQKGAASDQTTIDLYVTDQPILTTRGDNGHYVDFVGYDMFEPLAQGGAEMNDRPFSYYADDNKVILFNLFGVW